MNLNIKISLMLSLLLSTSAMAYQEAVTDVEARYAAKSAVNAGEVLKQSVNLGFSQTTGNVEVSNFNGKYDFSVTTLGFADQALKVGFDASLFMTKVEGDTNNKEFTVNLGLEQYVMNDWLGYTSINWLSNEFRNFDNKFAIGAGVGTEIFNDGQHSLKFKVGMAYNVEQYVNGAAESTFTSLNEYIEYNNKLNDVSTLYFKVGAAENIEEIEKNYEVTGVFGLNFAIAENVSLSIEEELRYDKTPPVGFEDLDTKTIIRVGYNF